MRPSPRLLVPLVLVLAPACGGSDLPTVDATVAEDLAGRADLLASQLQAGDACGARETAGALVTVTSQGRDAGTVPAAIAGEVIDTTRGLVRGVTCEPEPDPDPAPPADSGDEDGDRSEGRGKGDGMGEANGRDGDDEKDDEKDDD